MRWTATGPAGDSDALVLELQLAGGSTWQILTPSNDLNSVRVPNLASPFTAWEPADSTKVVVQYEAYSYLEGYDEVLAWYFAGGVVLKPADAMVKWTTHF